jgi:ferredoxin-NADP reductase/Na+-translocating ferredoxin:NAD+ oxidoreductase RnfD subunit
MPFIDSFLNRITMYRLVLYVVSLEWLAALLLSLGGLLPYHAVDLLFSLLVLLMVSWAAQTLFSIVFEAATNIESVYITAFILALLVTPVAPQDALGVGALVSVALWATASKYVLAIGKKHLFNPAALGIFLSSILLGTTASWWAGGSVLLLPLTLVGGLLIAHKIRRLDLVGAFMIATLGTLVMTSGSTALIMDVLLRTPIFFLAGIMLTEPLTMPPTRRERLAYGALVGILFTPTVHVGSLFFSPEMALLIGNVFVYLVSPKGRYRLTFIERREIGDHTYELLFRPDRPLHYQPGQYVEWTLPHERPDTRGNRRFFTLASSPTESLIKLEIKTYADKVSTFKQALLSLHEGDTLSVSSLAGDFTLPARQQVKIVGIAGGIGVTPFRSMAQYRIDTQDRRPLTLFYSNKTAREIAYRDVFDRAEKETGMKMVYTLTDEPALVPGTVSGMITADLIRHQVPDYKERVFYLSGPHAMVVAFKKTLRDMGVPRLSIKTDYFPGFV